MMIISRLVSAYAAVALIATAAISTPASAEVSEAETKAIAQDAYIFGFPIVMS